MGDEFRQSLALLPGRSEAWVSISKPVESRIKEFVRGRSVPSGALSVEGPTKNKLRRTIMVGSHTSEPMVSERRLSNTSPGHNRNDVHVFACPRAVQKSDILFSTKNIASGHGQSGDGNLLRCNPC